MFRKMRRHAQQLSQAECEQILREATCGVLAVQGDDGYPYTVPVNHVYEEGKLAFHCARQGHKIDAMKASNKVSYCVYDQGTRIGDDWPLHFKSVIVFGKVEFIEDRETIYRISAELSHKFTHDEAYIQKEIDRSGPRTLMFALTPEHISGKKVKES